MEEIAAGAPIPYLFMLGFLVFVGLIAIGFRRKRELPLNSSQTDSKKLSGAVRPCRLDTSEDAFRRMPSEPLMTP